MHYFAKINKVFLCAVAIIVIFGLLIFASASLGVLSINEIKFYSILQSQFIYALFLGVLALACGISIPFTFYEKYAWHIFIFCCVLSVLVFVPIIQIYHGGAHRWIHVGPITMQPVELLKFGAITLLSMWCARYTHVFKKAKYGLYFFLAVAIITSLLVLKQPDFGSYAIIIISLFTVYVVGGAYGKHIAIVCCAFAIGCSFLLITRPYMAERVKTFFNNDHDVKGSSWQLNQSLIAIGSGGFFGRGYGQSVQKFNYLPEPVGDSIFAVMAEELGFMGILFLFVLYGIVVIQGMRIAVYSESQFGKLLVIGIITIIISQIVLNVGSMIGVIPLTGVTLPFISHGGTSLLILLFEVGVILNISKQSQLP